MVSAAQCYAVFQRSIDDYHTTNDVDSSIKNPYPSAHFEYLLYLKNWIDTVQWHLEDIIRNPGIDPEEGIRIKRRIDASNQDRTDTVEKIDDYFRDELKGFKTKPGARLNSETPAWLLDRMSILMLKIYHMKEQAERNDATSEHVKKCIFKLEILLEQKADMAVAFDELLQDIVSGTRWFKVYRQMKMYNDASLNPVLYNRSAGDQ
jgi:hypothetical protein